MGAGSFRAPAWGQGWWGLSEMGNQERQVWGQHCGASMGLGGEGLEGTQRVSGARGLELRLGAWPSQARPAWQWVSWGQRRQPGEA